MNDRVWDEDVISAEYVDGLKFSVVFGDGTQGVADLTSVWNGPLPEQITREGRESDFVVDSKLGTIVWYNGLDIAPETLHTSLLP